MNAALAIVGLVALQRLAELILAQRNQRRLMARGGVEVGRGHYPLLVALHAAWLAALALAVAPGAPVSMAWLAIFLLLQAARVWVIASLGGYWTTRIVSIPGEPLVRRGPYRFLRHPNYAVVALEVPVLPLVFGQVALALGFGLANLAVVAWRIRVEERSLAPRRAAAAG
jgi:methyltransferase